jgi:hypothetical protein
MEDIYKYLKLKDIELKNKENTFKQLDEYSDYKQVLITPESIKKNINIYEGILEYLRKDFSNLSIYLNTEIIHEHKTININILPIVNSA